MQCTEFPKQRTISEVMLDIYEYDESKINVYREREKRGEGVVESPNPILLDKFMTTGPNELLKQTSILP